jgi:putative membrane protein
MAVKKIFSLLILSPLFFFACEGGPHKHSDLNYIADLDSKGILWLFLLIIIGFVIYLALDANRSKNDDVSIAETPLEILKKRFAKGEIDKEEFEQKKKDLET